jgi:O-antigen/teichoic acid export membrane protein
MTGLRTIVTRIRGPFAGSVLAGVGGQAVMVISGVLVARLLGVENRGQLALLVLIPAVLSQLGNLGLPPALTYFIARAPDQTHTIVRRLAMPVLWQTVLLLCLHALILALVLRDAPDSVRLAGALTLGAIPAALVQSYGLAILQGRQRFRSFYVLWNLPVTLYSLSILGLYLIGAAQLPQIAFAGVASTALVGVVTLVLALHGLPPTGGQEPVPARLEMLRFGLKGLLGSASPVESFRLDQAVVGFLLSPLSLGLYVVAVAFTNLPRFVAASVGIVAFPRVAREADRHAARRTMWNYFWLTIAVCVLIVGVLVVGVTWLVPLFFGEDFRDAVPIARILLINVLFVSARRVLTDGARGAGLPTLGTMAEVVSWLTLLPALLICTPRWGVTGVATALTISSVASLAALLVPLVSASRSRSYEQPSSGGRDLRIPTRNPQEFLGFLPSMRWTRVIVSALLVAAVAGFAGGLVAPTFDALLVGAIALVLALPMLQRLIVRRFDPFEPIVLFSGAWAVMFVLRPIAMLVTNNFEFGPGTAMSVESTFTEMLALALVGAITFMVGYALPLGGRVGRRLKPPATTFDPDTVAVAALAVAGAGILLFGVFLMQSGGMSAVRSLLGGRDAISQSDFYRASTSYLYSAPLLLIPSALALCATGAATRRRLLTVLGVAIVVLLLIRSLPMGSRMTLLPFVGGAVVYVYLARARRPRGLTLLAGAIVLLLGSTLLHNVRSAEARRHDGVVQIALKAIADPSGVIENLTSGADSEMAPALAAALQAIPGSIPHSYGAAVIGDLLIRPIPRILWPGKPLPPREQLLANLWPVEYEYGLANPEFSTLLYFYMDAGILGVAGGLLLYGVAARTLYEYLHAHNGNLTVDLLYAVTLPFFVIGLRDSPVDTIIRASYVVVPVVAIFFVGNGSTERFRRAHQNSRLPGMRPISIRSRLSSQERTVSN